MGMEGEFRGGGVWLGTGDVNDGIRGLLTMVGSFF
jgi:hypothetical protein